MEKLEEIVALANQAKGAAEAGDLPKAAEIQGRAVEIAQGALPGPPAAIGGNSQDEEQLRLLAVLYLRLGRFFELDNRPQHAVKAYELGFAALTKDKSLKLQPAFESMFERRVSKTYKYVPLSETVHVSADLYSPQAAADLEEATEDPLLAVKLLINIGNVYFQMPQLRPARHRYKLALKRPEIAGASELQAVAHTHLGLIAVRRGENDDAAHQLEKALAAFDEAGVDRAERRQALLALASVRTRQGETAEGKRLFQEALGLYRQAGDELGEQRALTNLGHIERLAGRWEEAEQAFRAGLALQPPSPDRQALGYLHWGLGLCRWQRGALAEAAASLERSLGHVERSQAALRTDEGKVAFLDSVQEIYDALIRIRVEQAEEDAGHFEALLALIDRARGRAFRDLLAGRQRKRDRAAAERRRQQQPSRDEPPGGGSFFNQMAQTAMNVGSDLLDPRPDLANNPRQDAGHVPSGDLPDQLLAEGPAGERLPLEPAATRPEAASRPVARLLFYVLPEKTVALAVAAGGEIGGHVLHLSEGDLAGQIGALRAALAVDAPRGVEIVRGDAEEAADAPAGAEDADYGQQLQQFYGRLVGPLDSLLPEDGTPVVVEPHGPLWLLPFMALVDGKGRTLAERAPLLTVPTYPVLEAIRAEPAFDPPAALRALVAGNPTMPTVPRRGNLSIILRPLPGAEEEARAVAARFPEAQVELLLGDEATAGRVTAALPSHQIVHLATHGIAFAEDPNASFIALAAGEKDDGLFDVRDVFDAVIDADLVVLSACQTGLGKVSGDGVIGLGRAFLAAGARSVLVSQWNVSDTATAALMSRFYHHYLAEQDKALALQRAVQELRQQPKYAHPRFWAPFMLIGAER